MRYSNRQGGGFYSSGTGRWVTVYVGSRSNEHSRIAGFFDLGGSVYKGSPGNDKSSRLGYVDNSGMIYKGSPGNEHSSLIGYVVRSGSTLNVFEGRPGSDQSSHVADVHAGSADNAERDALTFCGACLLFSLVDRIEREMAVCPSCGRLRHPHDPIEFRFCSYCGYISSNLNLH